MTDESPLSERETEVLGQLVTGASNNEIAQTLHISPNTVKVHVRNIYSKLGVLSRAEATTEALRRGIIIMPGVNDTEVVQEVPGALEAPVINAEPEPIRETPAQSTPSSATSTARPHVALPHWLVWGAFGILAALAITVIILLIQNPQQPNPIVEATGTADFTSLENTLKPLPPLPEATADAAGIYVEDSIYIVGGIGDQGTTANMWRFQPSRGVWEALRAKPTAASGVSAGVIRNELYVPGGIGANGRRLQNLEIYDFATATWRQGPELPTPRSDYGLATIEGQLYLFGGHDETGPVSTTLVYNPDREQWSEGTPLPIPLSEASVAQRDERQIFVMGGITTSDQPNLRTWRYLNGEWQERASLPNERINARAVFVTDRLYLVGGSNSGQTVLNFYGNTWKIEDLDLQALSQHVMVSDRRSVYIFGGWNGATVQREAYIWDPIITVFIPSINR